MSAEDAYELLESIATISGSQDKLKRVANISSKQNDEARKKKPAVNFAKCNIPVGAELVFIEDPTVKVIVESERKVSYNNEITSLSAVAGRIKGVKAIAGPSYFTYNGKLVCDIAKETQWKE